MAVNVSPLIFGEHIEKPKVHVPPSPLLSLVTHIVHPNSSPLSSTSSASTAALNVSVESLGDDEDEVMDRYDQSNHYLPIQHVQFYIFITTMILY